MTVEDVYTESYADEDTGESAAVGDRLFTTDDSAAFEERWREVQTRFVDDPEQAVQDADRLVADVMNTLSERFSDHKASLEQQWTNGDVETEDLRQALQHYRAFFHRLLAIPASA